MAVCSERKKHAAIQNKRLPVFLLFLQAVSSSMIFLSIMIPDSSLRSYLIAVFA